MNSLPPATSAAVTVLLRIRDGSQLTMEIESQSGRVTVEGTFDRLGISSQKTAIKRDLDRFTGALGKNVEVGFGEASKALQILHARGRTLLQSLFCRQPDKLKQAIDLFRASCPGWRRAGWDEDVPPPSLVQVDAPVRDIVPFDLLPILQYDEPGEVYDLDSLARAANSFLGFSAIVERRILTKKPSEGVKDTHTLPLDANPELLNGDPKLRIQFFRYSGLSGAQIEERFLSNHPLVEFDGPWPKDGEAIPEFSRELAANLLEPTQGFYTQSPCRPDQISHFACHCDTSPDNYEDYTLKLAGVGLWPAQQTVTYRELQDKFFAFDMESPNKHSSGTDKVRPLIFLNACGSSEVDPAGLASFPELFLDFGHRGFIGTETKIPDRFAAAFSEAFYVAFLNGERLGEAIYRARWNSLKRFRNPLGLLYGVYANPDMRVSSHRSHGSVSVPTTP
jgi:hypothetical protein